MAWRSVRRARQCVAGLREGLGDGDGLGEGLGEGGAVYTDNDELAVILASLRDWGRDCTCPSGVVTRTSSTT